MTAPRLQEKQFTCQQYRGCYVSACFLRIKSVHRNFTHETTYAGYAFPSNRDVTMASDPPLDYRNLVLRGFEMETTIRSGEHMCAGNVSWDYDDGAEFKIDQNDARYQACLQKARELKKQYPLEGLDAKRDRETIVCYERAIAVGLLEKIHEEFGYYNPAVSKAHDEGKDSSDVPEAVHNDIMRALQHNPVNLAEFQKNELICRHYAPLMSALCEEAGLHTFHVSGFAKNFGPMPMGHGAVMFAGMASNERPTRHAYSISRATGNIIEPSTSAASDGYLYNLNHVSVEEFLVGHTVAAVSSSGGIIITYGTGQADGHAIILDNRREKIGAGDLTELPSYTPAETGIEQAKAISAHDLPMAHKAYTDIVLAFNQRFRKAVKSGDVPEARACCDHFLATKELLAQQLNVAIETAGLPMAEMLIERGALSGYDDFTSKGQVLFSHLPSENIADHKPFLETMIGKLQLSDKAVLYSASKWGKAAHIEFALDHIQDHLKTPELKTLLVSIEQTLHESGSEELAGRVRIFRETHYKDDANALPVQESKPVGLLIDEVTLARAKSVIASLKAGTLQAQETLSLPLRRNNKQPMI
jgi:hypothetical protein